MKKNILTTIVLFSTIVVTYAQNITTVAGDGTGGYSGNGGSATAAEIMNPQGVATDSQGNIYIADPGNNVIRKVDLAGNITTVAGNNAAGYTGDGGAATAAELHGATNVKVDASGNIYIGDYYNNCIRKVNTSGIISTVVGNGIPGYSGDGGQATAAEIDRPHDIAIDASGDLYIVDVNNSCIRKVNTSGIISTFAGNGIGGYSGDGGQATAAELDVPLSVALDASGNLYITDKFNNAIRKVNTSGVISTFAGNGTAGYNGDGIQATSAEINAPWGIALDAAGNVYIGDDLNNRIRKINTSGTITTIAGNGTPGYSGDGGVATVAKIDNPLGVAVDASGSVYIGDYSNFRVRKVSTPYPPIANFSANDSIFCIGNSVQFTDKSSQYPSTWKWTFAGGNPDSSTQQNPTVAYDSAGTYTVKLTVSNAAGADSISKTSYIVVNPTPTVTISGGSTLCIGADMLTATTSGNAPFSYKWSTAGTNDTIMVNNANTFSVTVTDSNGCVSNSSFKVMNDPVPFAQICLVSVDTSSTHNIIVWNNTGLTRIDSFKIYYLNSSLAWQLIKAVPFSSPDYFVDSTPINNPNANTVRYCLTAVDSCGNEEAVTSSPWQNTMHINQAPAGTFTWAGTGYLKQGITTPVVTYYLFRDSISNGNWVAIDSTNGTQNTMSDAAYQINPSNYPLARWYVGAKLSDSVNTGCTVPLLRPTHAVNYSSSRSNAIYHNTITSALTQALTSNSISLYPNPAGQNLNIKFNNKEPESARISIMDITGREVYNSQLTIDNGQRTINVSALSTGIYFVKVTTNTSSQVVKFIKE
ncbi:MAG: T9SS type A sorting domain-containing protein [Bacteroidia bacterium]